MAVDVAGDDEIRLHYLNRIIATATFQHQSTRQQMHSFLLQMILGKPAGRIPEVDDHDENTMIFEMKMARKTPSATTSLFTWTSENDTAAADFMDVDQEILACFLEPVESVVIRVSVTTFPLENDPVNWCSVFKLLGCRQQPVVEGASELEKNLEQIDGWVLDQFDDVCLDLMNNTPSSRQSIS